jgi:hypothetical protein
MPMPVEVTHIKRCGTNASGVEGLGGMWNGPWYMSERSVIAEVECAEYWTFFVCIDGKTAPLTVTSIDGRKHLMVAGKPVTLLRLLAWRDMDERGWPVIP